jgi:hypothetical protein
MSSNAWRLISMGHSALGVVLNSVAKEHQFTLSGLAIAMPTESDQVLYERRTAAVG